MTPWMLLLALVLAPDPGDPAPAKKPSRAEKPPAAEQPSPGGSEDVGTLDAITIEGEIDVPEVLFITASDRPRFHDGLHRRYLPAAREVARDTVLPTRLAVRLDP